MNVSSALVKFPAVWADEQTWRRKLADDESAIGDLLPSELAPLHDVVVRRARSSCAHTLILSGSTARGERTEISDLDYHLIGSELETADLSLELDIHSLSPSELETEILRGDDFVQWSLRFGRVVFDDGTARSGLRLIDQRRPWPDSARKREHAMKSLALAERFVATGDEDGALDQVRTALSLAARAQLLEVRVFPLCRSEMPGQLAVAGFDEAATALHATIGGAPSLEALEQAVGVGRRLLGSKPEDQRRPEVL